MARKRKRRTTATERTAYHEAGHAVMAAVVGRAFCHVTIEPGEDSLGHVMFGRLSEKLCPDLSPLRMYGEDARTRRIIESCVMADFGGMVAERRLAGKLAHTGATKDCDDADTVSYSMCGTAEEAKKYLDWLYCRAEGMLALPQHWAAVEALAAQLLEHRRLSAPRARRIIKDAMEEYYQRELRRRDNPCPGPSEATDGPPGGQKRVRSV